MEKPVIQGNESRERLYAAKALRRISAVSLVILMCTTSPLAVGVVMAQETQPGDACTAGETGYFRFAGDDTPGPAVTGENFMFCDGANWVGFLYYDDTNSTVTLAQSAHFIGSGQVLPAAFDDNGTRMFFYPDKKAFRGGEITGGNTAWADANIGVGSFSWGLNTKASGAYSVAMGAGSEASGAYSFAAGKGVASGDYSLAAGKGIASGYSSVAIGMAAEATNTYAFAAGTSKAHGVASVAMGNSIASGDNSVALGDSAVAAGNRSFAVHYGIATGNNSVAFGSQVVAGDGLFVGGDPESGSLNPTVGEVSMVFSLQTATQATAPKVTGDRTIAFFFDGNTIDANSGVDVTTSDAFIIYGGKVGIGMTDPSVELDVTGSIEYTGTIADMSDRRLKTDIVNLPAGQLQKILDLESVSFKMKDDPKGQIEFGFIAQDARLHYPELVYENKDGMLSMNYVGLIAPMAEALEEQRHLVEEQSAMIEELKKRTMALQDAQRKSSGR